MRPSSVGVASSSNYGRSLSDGDVAGFAESKISHLLLPPLVDRDSLDIGVAYAAVDLGGWC